MWANSSGVLTWAATSRRFRSFQAGSMLLKSAGVGPSPYHPIPKPSPLVVVAPIREWRLWSISECCGRKSSSSATRGSPEYAIHLHMSPPNQRVPGRASSGGDEAAARQADDPRSSPSTLSDRPTVPHPRSAPCPHPDADVHGPVDFALLEFPRDRLTGEAAEALMDLVEAGTIRLYDLLVIARTPTAASRSSSSPTRVVRRPGSPTSPGPVPGCSATRTSRRRPPRWSRTRSRRCSSTRTPGRRRSSRPPVAAVASWSPAHASPRRTSWPPSRRSRPRAEEDDVMPGLLRGVARTAVVAGTATAVSGRVQRRQAEKFAGRDARSPPTAHEAYDEQQQPQEPAAPAATRRTCRGPDPAAQGAGRAQGPGRPHRGGVRRAEGEGPRQHLTIAPRPTRASADSRIQSRARGGA